MAGSFDFLDVRHSIQTRNLDPSTQGIWCGGARSDHMPRFLVKSTVGSRSIDKIMVGRDMSDDNRSRARPTRRAVFRLSGGTALVGAVPGIYGLSTQVTASEQAQAGSPVIDTHIHVVPPGLPGIKAMPEDVDRLYKGPLSEMAARLKVEMELAKINHAFGMGSVQGPVGDPLGIGGTIALAKLVPGLKAIGVADPRRVEPFHLKAVEAQIEQNRQQVVGLKAYLGYLHFGPEDPNYRPYYKLAAKHHLPVIVHTGDNWSTTAKVKYAHPLKMDEVAVDHPEVQFVLAHFGNPWLIDAAEVVFKNPNVWADLSGLFVGNDNEIQDLLCGAKVPDSAPGLVVADLKRAIAYVGDYKKFLYGSDWPLAPMSSYRRLIESLIPREHHQEVFRTNAMNLFKL
jgi:predicted TIM-barrel fold metal-dependent hydrolase